MAKQVVFTIGAGGSGKSWAIANSEYAHLPVVNSDSHIESHPDFISGVKTARDLHEWAEGLMEQDWFDRLAGDDSFIIDGTGKTRANVDRRMEQARAAGFKVVIVWVYAPLETCLARNASRPRQVPAEVIADAHGKVKNNFGHYRREADRVKVLINV